ncbi:MAG: hypothetical protein ACOY9J_10445 [Pseudomonadota bacterium]
MSALLLGLAGCDIAPDARLGDPINSGAGGADGSQLDPNADGNIAVFFYLDRPVVGLRFSCTSSGALPIITGQTDGNGRLVCPRRARLAFFIGDPAELKLGEVDLGIFGREGEADARNYVTVTPATLAGTLADSNNAVVTNTFNLLTTLDAGTGGGRQAVIHITDAVHTAFSPHANSLALDAPVIGFDSALETIALAIHAETANSLRNGGLALTDVQARVLADTSILRARSGMYRSLGGMSDTNDFITSLGFSGKVIFSVARSGRVAGIAQFTRIDNGVQPPGFALEIGPLVDDSRLLPDGRLVHGTAAAAGLRWLSAANDDLLLTGRLVNDWLFGNIENLDPEQNHRVPSNYVFSSTDLGYFRVNGNQFEGETSVYASALNTPGIELDELPAEFLPRTIGLKYRGYPDGEKVTDAQRASSTYLNAETEHELFFRILADGDIVSDVDRDCEDISLVGNQLRDASSTQEFYVGHVGAIFKDDEGNPYITMILAIYEPGHPQYGFTLGAPALGRSTLDSVVYDVNRGELRSKNCDPKDDPCTEPVEWFDDVFYIREVLKPILAQGITDVEDADLYFRDPGYYGQITLNADICTVPP